MKGEMVRCEQGHGQLSVKTKLKRRQTERHSYHLKVNMSSGLTVCVILTLEFEKGEKFLLPKTTDCFSESVHFG